jgi:hypothetical protein
MMQPAGNEGGSYYHLRVTAHCNRRRPSPNANQWWKRGGKIVSVSKPNRTNEALQRARELQRGCNFYTALLAMAAHDPRQPLQVILNIYPWLARRLTTGSEREYLERGRLALAIAMPPFWSTRQRSAYPKRAECTVISSGLEADSRLSLIPAIF